MKKKNKDKDEKNLVWIDKPIIDDKGKSNALSIAIETWDMYNADFNLTIRDICHILKCERKWVINYVKDDVKHIFINENFRSYLNVINNQKNLNTFNEEGVLKDYYYFSRKDFFRWLKEKTKITRQTIVIMNINDYAAAPKGIIQLKQKYDKKQKELIERNGNSKELRLLKLQYQMKRYPLLTEEGRNLLKNEVSLTKRDAESIDVTQIEEIPLNFTTVKELKGDKSLELVYRSLYKHGALKYTIAGSLVRYDEDYIQKELNMGIGETIIVPYAVYLENR